jgi:ABC-type multidrug transport system ATPase subunit
MKINSFEAKNVHGYLNYYIDFFSVLTFLIGINGSGKTSALKLILGLITPSFQYLNQIDYEFAELKCSTTELEQDIIIIILPKNKTKVLVKKNLLIYTYETENNTQKIHSRI